MNASILQYHDIWQSMIGILTVLHGLLLIMLIVTKTLQAMEEYKWLLLNLAVRPGLGNGDSPPSFVVRVLTVALAVVILPLSRGLLNPFLIVIPKFMHLLLPYTFRCSLFSPCVSPPFHRFCSKRATVHFPLQFSQSHVLGTIRLWAVCWGTEGTNIQYPQSNANGQLTRYNRQTHATTRKPHNWHKNCVRLKWGRGESLWKNLPGIQGGILQKRMTQASRQQRSYKQKH